MKKILSFITLLIFIIIGFYHSSMSVFASKNNVQNNLVQDNFFHNLNKVYSNKQNTCLKNCCIKGVVEHGIFAAINNTQYNQFKGFICYNIVSLEIFTEYWQENKNLLHKNSPPYYTKNIKNYSYYTLTKIIKSNT